jgi:hypothetical protein
VQAAERAAARGRVAAAKSARDGAAAERSGLGPSGLGLVLKRAAPPPATPSHAPQHGSGLYGATPHSAAASEKSTAASASEKSVMSATGEVRPHVHGLSVH